MTPEQCRAARGWLGWTQAELSTNARVGLSTVKDFESGNRVPIANNLTAMRRAFEEYGIELLFDATGSAMGIAGRTMSIVEDNKLPADGSRRQPGPRGRQSQAPRGRGSG